MEKVDVCVGFGDCGTDYRNIFACLVAMVSLVTMRLVYYRYVRFGDCGADSGNIFA